MVKVILVNRTQPDLPIFLRICNEFLGRRVSNLSDSRPRQFDLQKFSLMLSEAIDEDVDNSILDNLGPVLSHISFTFCAVIHDSDYLDLSTTFSCEMIRIPTRVSGVSMIIFSATLKKLRELIIDSLSSNIMNYTVLDIIAEIYNLVKNEGFNKLWSDINIERNKNGHLIEGR